MLTNVGVCQIDITLGDISRNLETIQRVAQQAADGGSRLIVFPEACLTGYCFESLGEALPVALRLDDLCLRPLEELCRTRNLYLVAGLLEREGDRVFNTAVLWGPGGIVSRYRKIHLPYLGIDQWTTPGDEPFSVVEIEGLRIGLSICYDAAFPEASRTLALLGADLILLPTNWPPGAEIMPRQAVPVRAMENGVYYAAASRIGIERGNEFLGLSRICDPAGRVIAEAGSSQEAILQATIDVGLSRNKHVVRVPGASELHRFGDRRPEMYDELLKPHAFPRPHDLPR